MVSFSNGSLSNEVNKRPLENGRIPQFKPRKVSAIRDFPPGCGPNAVPMNLRQEEVCGSEAGGKDAICVVSVEPTNTSVERQSREEVSSSSSLSFRDWAGVNGSIVKPVGETLDTLMEKAKTNVTVSKELVMGIGSVGTKILDEAASNKQEAVNNPVEIERDEQLDTYVGNVETMVINGLPNEVQETMLERDLVGVDLVNNMKTLDHCGDHTVLEELKEDKSLASFRNSGVEVVKSPSNTDVSTGKDHLLDNPLVFSASCGSIQSGTFIRPRDKYRPRRVSAVRDFPPNCGTNVSLSIEREKEMTTPGKDSLNRTEAVESMPEPTVLIDAIVREIAGEILTSSSGECVDGLHNVHVEIEKSDLNDDAGRGFLGEIKVATAEGGAMEFEECSIDLQHGITQDIGARAGSGTIAKALVSVEDARGPVGKKTSVSSPDRNDEDRPPHSDFSFWNNSNRELVHGLMAAPNCPWRKSKGAFNSPDDLKTRKQNVPLSQKPNDVAFNSNLEANSSGYPTLKNVSPDLHHGYKTPGKSTFIDGGDHGAGSGCIRDATPISMFKPDADNSDNVYSPGYSDEEKNSQTSFGSKDDVDREVVHGLMAAPQCPWRKEKTITPSSGGTRGGKKRKQNFSWRQKAKAVATKSKPEIQSSDSLTKKNNKVHVSKDVGEEPDDLALEDDKDLATNYCGSHKRHEAEISLPRFGPKTSGPRDARIRVREVLRLFNGMCRKLLQQDEADPAEGEEGKSKQSGRKARRIDLIAAQNLKDKKISVNTVKMIGSVPGVEVGDEFQYRVELAVVGIHFPYQSGIDSAKFDDVSLATSIVTSGAYFDDVENADVLRYSGQGGNVVGKCKIPEDQKMERGNLALKNCIATKTPVRVVRGWKEMKIVDPLDSKPKLVTTYVYDGLYTVTNYCTEEGPHGKKVFMFELKRNPGQPELAWKELKKSTKFKKRPGVCIDDISEGKERIPIWAVNTVDGDKPPSFNYISKRMYPEWYRPKPAAGCDCVGNCSIRKKCKCILRNGGEIPYNHNGALVETKTLVYECGPHCKCPPSCYNRSTQRGIKFQLEVFKTESRGWGVRALTSITSGSFICEYAGELLEDKEAEKRIGNDEYLFDIANPEDEEDGAEPKGGCFTIDAKTYGNVGRFINHSCAPNLYAQNVIYDNNDKRMPHVMLFAMENIPPLTELTYSYNYSLGQIRDSEGNIKVKKCYCGAAGCTGRLY